MISGLFLSLLRGKSLNKNFVFLHGTSWPIFWPIIGYHGVDFSNLLCASWPQDLITFSLPELLFCFSAIPKCSAILPAPGVFCFFILLAAVQRYSLLPLNSIGIILVELFISANYNYRNGMNSYSACWGAAPSPGERRPSVCGCAILGIAFVSLNLSAEVRYWAQTTLSHPQAEYNLTDLGQSASALEESLHQPLSNPV